MSGSGTDSAGAALSYRRFEAADRKPVYKLFRDTVWDYMLRRGMVDEFDSYDLDQFFELQRGLYIHLEQNACEDWVAHHDSLGPIGWARSIERDGHLQLTHFFVDPQIQGGGIGRELLNRAFAPGRGRKRSIIATQNSLALSLYLRYGVAVMGMALTFHGKPKRRAADGNLEVETLPVEPASLDAIGAIDRAVLGYERPAELGFFLREQPAYLFHRGGEAVAYAFGCNGKSSGPAAALEPADLPAVLCRIEASALEIGIDELWLNLPTQAHTGVTWALDCGYRIDPFQEVLLASGPFMQLDRYLMTESGFVW